MGMTPEPRVGMVFTHARRLDVHWRPREGQTYRDAPHAVYRITGVTASDVYYEDAAAHYDGRGRWRIARVRWAEAYGGPAPLDR